MADPYIDVDDLRARMPAVADKTKYPDDMLEGYISQFESLAERYRGAPFVERERNYTRTASCDDTLRVVLPDLFISEITACTIDGEDIDLDTLTLASYGIIQVPLLGDLAVTYTCRPAIDPIPPGLVTACCFYVRFSALYERSSIGQDGRDPSTVANADGGFTRFVTADWNAGRPTRFPVVNDFLNEIPDFRVPAVA